MYLLLLATMLNARALDPQAPTYADAKAQCTGLSNMNMEKACLAFVARNSQLCSSVSDDDYERVCKTMLTKGWVRKKGQYSRCGSAVDGVSEDVSESMELWCQAITRRDDSPYCTNAFSSSSLVNDCRGLVRALITMDKVEAAPPADASSLANAPMGSDDPRLSSGAALDLVIYGDLRMRREDVRTTVEVVKKLEEVVIQSLQRHLDELEFKNVSSPVGGRGTRTQVVTLPDGTTKEIEVRSKRDTVPSVQERFLSRSEQKQMFTLANELPMAYAMDELRDVPTPFMTDLLALIRQSPVPMYEVRKLLPIVESGSLETGEVSFKGKTSVDLETEAKRIGAM